MSYTAILPVVEQVLASGERAMPFRLAHDQAGASSELVVVPGARHIDLYDRTDLIPFDKLDAFFTDNLA